jgi:hypothetical protein
MTLSCLLLLFFFLSMPEHLNSNTFISPSHTRRCSLLLHVRLHRAPSSVSFACASTPMPRCSSTPAPHSSSMSKCPGTAPSARPSPLHPKTAIGTSLLLHRRIHISLTSFTCNSSENPLPLSFPLPL